MKHKYKWCNTCKCYTTICGYCGNNGCNGGSGDNCFDDCKSAREWRKVNKPNILQTFREKSYWKLKLLIDNLYDKITGGVK